MAKQKSRKNNKSEKKLEALVVECCEAFARLYHSRAGELMALKHALETSKKPNKGAVKFLMANIKAQNIAGDQLDDAFARLVKALQKGKA